MFAKRLVEIRSQPDWHVFDSVRQPPCDVVSNLGTESGFGERGKRKFLFREDVRSVGQDAVASGCDVALGDPGGSFVVAYGSSVDVDRQRWCSPIAELQGSFQPALAVAFGDCKQACMLGGLLDEVPDVAVAPVARGCRGQYPLTVESARMRVWSQCLPA